MRVVAVPCLKDNFAYLVIDGSRAAVVDPSEAAPVEAALAREGVTLAAIWLTHHHWDHVGGAAELRSQTRCEVVGVDRSLIPASDRTVTGGEVLTFDQTQAEVIPTPGHTRTSASYYVRPQAGHEPRSSQSKAASITTVFGACSRTA